MEVVPNSIDTPPPPTFHDAVVLQPQDRESTGPTTLISKLLGMEKLGGESVK